MALRSRKVTLIAGDQGVSSPTQRYLEERQIVRVRQRRVHKYCENGLALEDKAFENLPPFLDLLAGFTVRRAFLKDRTSAWIFSGLSRFMPFRREF